MNEQPMEGNPGGGGELSATQPSSQTQGQPLEANLAETIAQLQRKIDAQDGEIRALKSGKDKAVDRVVKSQEETLAKLAKYLNVDENQVREAQRQSVIDDLISERLSGNQSATPIQGRVGEQDSSAGLRTVESFSVADAIEQIEKYNLSANDADVIQLLRDRSLSKEKVKDYILAKVAPQPTPSPAGVVQGAARSGATVNTEALYSELQELSKNPTKRGAMERMTAIKKQLEEAGG